jgi:hypothetical protein
VKIKGLMRKFTILLFAMALAFGTLSAQDLTLSWEGEPIESPMYVFGSQFDAEIVAHAVVTNNSSISRNLKVRRTQVEMQAGALSQFCWGLCYPPNVDESPQFLTLGPGESSTDEYFSGHYLPNGIWGASTVEYEFFDMEDEDVFVKVTVIYSATLASIGDQDEDIFRLYPNPATDQFTIESKSKMTRVAVFDLTGKEILSQQVDNLKIAMNVSNLESGVYLVRMETEKGTRVEKFYKR